jgi:hypothetical protein
VISQGGLINLVRVEPCHIDAVSCLQVLMADPCHTPPPTSASLLLVSQLKSTQPWTSFLQQSGLILAAARLQDVDAPNST